MTARSTREIVKRTAAKLAGKTRGPDPHVRRDSYDVADPRARVFRPIADGSVAGALGWVEDLLKVAREFDALGPREPSRRWTRPTRGSPAR